MVREEDRILKPSGDLDDSRNGPWRAFVRRRPGVSPCREPRLLFANVSAYRRYAPCRAFGAARVLAWAEVLRA